MSQSFRKYAIGCHKATNHEYDGHPYEFHLQMVVDEMHRFRHLIDPQLIDIVEDACWGHDLIEDCRQTYNDVRSKSNTPTADIIYALTNEKGRFRADRANDKYYQGIRNTECAIFVKLCDRLANARYSRSKNSSMLKVYWNENASFKEAIFDSRYNEMFDELDQILQP